MAPGPDGLHRRALLLGMAGVSPFPVGARAPSSFAGIDFGRDHGAHPWTRTEWWYITGHARIRAETPEPEFGFQITFFRSRVDATQSLRSAFAARQLIFAHAAVTHVPGHTFAHDQRIAREGFGIARADVNEAALRLRDWSLRRDARGNWNAHIPARDFTLDLQFEPTQAPLLQGEQGWSRKGPEATQGSSYYSLPQLSTQGMLTLRGKAAHVTGQAWLDHEWSESLLPPGAVGWDWLGMNLSDGGALTIFRLRNSTGHAVWAGGSRRTRHGDPVIFHPSDVVFTPQRWWSSPLTGARYPVVWLVQAGQESFRVEALLDAQELDSRASTGAVYWEGLSRLSDAWGRHAGYGYLEMTGYTQPLRL